MEKFPTPPVKRQPEEIANPASSERLSDLKSQDEVLKNKLAEYHNRKLTREEFEAANQLAYELTCLGLEIAKERSRLSHVCSAMGGTPPAGYPRVMAEAV